MTNRTTSTICPTITPSDCNAGSGSARVEIYTDGATDASNPGPAGWGFVAVLLTEKGEVLDVLERNGASPIVSTNNRAEMAGALNALAFAAAQQASGAWPVCPITIVSDSQYVVKGYTEWMPNWEARGWRTSTGKSPENRDLWERLKVNEKGLGVNWRWIKGHDGNRWNDRADALAKDAARRSTAILASAAG